MRKLLIHATLFFTLTSLVSAQGGQVQFPKKIAGRSYKQLLKLQRENPSYVEKSFLERTQAQFPKKIAGRSYKQLLKLQRENPSYVEKSFLERTQALNVKLRQFGYNFFLGRPHLALSVPVDKSYVLGPGDELFLYVIGNPPGVNLSKISRLVVDREGKVYMPGLGVFYVWGMALGDAEKLISRSLGTNIKLTVGRLRTFPVYVSGEVRRPGSVVVTGVNTVIDAIMMAGGIQKDGTLRNIIVTRRTSNGLKRIHIDFYKLLLEGRPVDMRLKDGDVIFVGPVGKVAGIGGKVKRPAIYELKGNETVEELIKMAGGLLPSSYKYKVIIQRYRGNQYSEVLEGSLNDKHFINQNVHDGDLIEIKQIVSIPRNAVMVNGYTPYPGLYEYEIGMKLSDLLKQDFFFPDSNMKFGLIKRIYPLGSTPKYITFSPEDVLSGKEDVELKPRDRVVLYKFGQTKVVDFNKVKDAFVVEGEVKYPGVYAYKDGMKLSEVLTPDMLTLNTNLYYAEIDRRDPKTLAIVEIKRFTPIDVINGKEDLEVHSLDVIRFYPKYVYPPVKVSGLVKRSYYLPYHKGLKLSEALAKADFTEDIKKLKVEVFREASKAKSSQALQKAQNIKVTAEGGKEVIKQNVASIFLYDLLVRKDSKFDITLNPGDRLVIQEVKPDEMVEKVTVLGYVKHPGVFKINEKTTLYDVLRKAGGFRENAYPYGIVVLRKSVRAMQKEELAKAIILMKQELTKEEAGVMQSDLTAAELRARQSAFEAKRRLLTEMEKAQVTGRISGIVVPSNLKLLKNSPDNIFLEDGDKIYIPKKPGSVLTFGELYNPSALVYRKGFTVQDYINEAGGLTKDADKDDIFVIKASGAVVSSQNMGEKSFDWESNSNKIVLGGNGDILRYELKPGDTIVVPTKVHVPIMWRPLIKDVMQIIYQGALTIYTITKL